MAEHDWLAERFEEQRPHLRAVAYRMLGSLNESEDAVQEAWLRLSRTDADDIANLGGWLTTVVSRICLDMLRSRTTRREVSLETPMPEPAGTRAAAVDPEEEALLADSVGLALLVVLDTLTPAERIAFVLHDTFAVPFEEIAPIVGRTPTATRQLASRARRRVQGAATTPDPDRSRQRAVVDAFLAAARSGDFEALLTLLDPEVELRIDQAAARVGAQAARGAAAVAAGAARSGAQAARPALVDGAPGVVVAPRGRLLMVLRFTYAGGRITAIDAIADPEHLRRLDLAVIES